MRLMSEVIEERRILERVRVLLQLHVGRLKVLVRALVLPAERAVLPDVGPAAATIGLRRTFLEGECLPGRIRFRRASVRRAGDTGR